MANRDTIQRQRADVVDVYITADAQPVFRRKYRSPWRSLQLLFLCLYAVSIVFCIQETYKLTASVPVYVMMAIAAILGCMAFWLPRRARFILPAAAMAGTLYAVLNYTRLRFGIRMVYNVLADRASDMYYGIATPMRVPAAYAGNVSTDVVLILVGAFVILLASYVFCKGRHFWVLFLSGLAVLAPGLLFNLGPGLLWGSLLVVSFLAALGICMFGKRRGSSDDPYAVETSLRRTKMAYANRRVVQKMAGGATIAMLIFTGTIMLLTRMAFSDSVYQTEAMQQTHYGARQWMQLIVEDRDTFGFAAGRLGMVKKMYTHGTSDLIVQTPYMGNTIYLRGFVGTDYIGNRWLPLSDEDTANYERTLRGTFGDSFHPQMILNQVAALNSESENAVFQETYQFPVILQKDEVWSKMGRQFTYMPYGAAYPLTGVGEYPVEYEADGDIQMDFDDFTQAWQTTVYTTEYPIGLDYEGIESLSAGGESLTQSEQAYRSYVYSTYTKMPDNWWGRVRREFTPELVESEGGLEGFIDYVRRFLDERSYERTDVKLPDGEDFVEYFLYESGRGYSTAFASAGVAIFRAAGIPARYAEGYVITDYDYNYRSKLLEESTEVIAPDGTSLDARTYLITLTDNSYHAWVEIYIDGYGWYPVELTPGYEQKVTNTPELMGGPRPFGNLGTSSLPPLTLEGIYDERPISQDTASVLKVASWDTIVIKYYATAGVLVAVIWVAVLGYLRRYYTKQLRLRRFGKLGAKHDVIEAFIYCTEVLQMDHYSMQEQRNRPYREFISRLDRQVDGGDDSLEQMMEIVLKARFSPHEIDEGQRELVLRSIGEFVGEYYNMLPWRRRLYYAFIKAIV